MPVYSIGTKSLFHNRLLYNYYKALSVQIRPITSLLWTNYVLNQSRLLSQCADICTTKHTYYSYKSHNNSNLPQVMDIEFIIWILLKEETLAQLSIIKAITEWMHFFILNFLFFCQSCNHADMLPTNIYAVGTARKIFPSCN